MLPRFIPILFLVSLVGCANPTIVSHVYYDHTEIIDVFRYAAGGRDFLVDIRGNPTHDPKLTFDGAVLSAMHGHHGGPPTKFTTTPSQATRKDYRIVFVFGAPPDFGSKSACSGSTLGVTTATGGRINIQAAFCHKDRPLSYARVSFGPISGPFDPRLASAVEQATLSLIPPYDPDYKQQNDSVLLPG